MAKNVRVVVKKSGWHAPEKGNASTADSALRSSYSRRKCCLGFCATTAGITGITDVAFPSQLRADRYEQFREKFPQLDLYGESLLADINDSLTLTRAEKVKEITKVGKQFGVNFVFV